MLTVIMVIQFVLCLQVTTLIIVPPIALLLTKHPLVSNYDLSSLEVITCGAAPLSGEISQELQKRLNLRDIRQGNGGSLQSV